MKLSVSVPDELWTEALASAGASPTHAVMTSRVIQIALREFVANHPPATAVAHTACGCLICTYSTEA